MSYSARVTGRIAVNPPVPVSEISDSRFLPSNFRRTGPSSEVVDVVFTVAELAIDGTDGFRRVVTAIEPVGGEWSYWSLGEHLTDAVRRVIYAGSTASGRMVRVGDEQGDVQRFIVAPTEDDSDPVEVEHAALRWPDGSPVTEAQR